MKKTAYLFVFLFLSMVGKSQTYNIKGTIFDAESNEKLSGVHINLQSLKNSQNYFTTTKLNGDFSLLQVKADQYKLSVSYLGYAHYDQEIAVDSDLEINIGIDRELITLGEVIVSSLKQDKKIKDVPVPLEITDHSKIELASSITLSDILQEEPGVNLRPRRNVGYQC